MITNSPSRRAPCWSLTASTRRAIRSAVNCKQNNERPRKSLPSLILSWIMSMDRHVKVYDMSAWLGSLWTRFQREIIEDVPPCLEACESCRETDCTEARWMTCAKRLAGEAERVHAFELGAPANPDDMLDVSSDEMPAAENADEWREAVADSSTSVASK